MKLEFPYSVNIFGKTLTDRPMIFPYSATVDHISGLGRKTL